LPLYQFSKLKMSKNSPYVNSCRHVPCQCILVQTLCRRFSGAPRHCKVGPWSEWSPCSLSCGIGESVRQREVLREPKRGGRECPQLTGLKWCGSARNCRESYFKWWRGRDSRPDILQLPDSIKSLLNCNCWRQT